jgi:hypothetical protein
MMADSRQALAQGAQPAPACRCERPMPDAEGICARCGRMVPIAMALAEAGTQ